jgi:hypothetical protein
LNGELKAGFSAFDLGAGASRAGDGIFRLLAI